MSMDDMIERVSRAIMKADMNPAGTWDDYSDLARAAMEEMREPTVDMRIQGARSIGNTMNVLNFNTRANKCWKQMVGEALKQKNGREG